MNALYIAAGFAIILTTIGIATHVMITNRWPWQRKPRIYRYHCRTCQDTGRRHPAKFNNWRDLHRHDLAQHRAR